jgi:hypothetical protein
VIVIVAEADFVPSLTDVAINVTVAGLGTAAGAVYVTAAPEAPVIADSDPHPPAVAHDAAHVTPLAALSLLTVAVKLCVPFVATEAVEGVTATEIAVVPPPPELDPPPHPPISNIPVAEIANANRIRPTRRARTRITCSLQYIRRYSFCCPYPQRVASKGEPGSGLFSYLILRRSNWLRN